MAAYSTSLLHPATHGTGPVAFSPAELCSAAPFALPLCCPFPPQYLYPPPPLPPSCGLAVGCDGWLAPMGSGAYAAGAPALPFLPWLHMPPPPPFPMALYYNPALKPPLPATRCSITEIVEDGNVEPPMAEVEDDPSPRSVLAPRRRSAALPPPSSGVVGSKPAFDGRSNKTSVMICNIPNGLMKRRLMAILDKHCAEENKLRCRPRGGAAVAKSEYDFLYLPIDFGTKCNKGYAFVNMTTPTAAWRLYAFLHGHPWAGSAKVCEVVHAHIQGVDALVAHFSRSVFPCGNNMEFLPVRFGPPRDGLRQTAERTIGCAVVRRRLR